MACQVKPTTGVRADHPRDIRLSRSVSPKANGLYRVRVSVRRQYQITLLHLYAMGWCRS